MAVCHKAGWLGAELPKPLKRGTIAIWKAFIIRKVFEKSGTPTHQAK